MRGFDENLLRFDQDNNAVGGVLSIMGSIEGRFSLGRNWETVLFVDTGHIARDSSEIGQYDFRWSAGLGLAYITPVGPVGLYYGRKLNQREGESPGQWHFSIGYTF